MQHSKLIVSLDNLSEEEVLEKIQLILKSEHSPKIVFKFNDLLSDLWLKWLSELLNNLDVKLFLDFKWHDIGSTLENYITKLHNSWLWDKVEFITIHSSNWYEAIKKICNKKRELGLKTKILAVTILTSLTDLDSNSIYDDNCKYSVLKLAKQSIEAWVDWIVCSTKESSLLREVYSDYDFEIVTPWVRFEWWDIWDQKRVSTPKQAIKNGSNHIVMWRPILQSNDMLKEIDRFFTETKEVIYKKGWNNYAFEKLLFTASWKEILQYIWAFYIRPEWWQYCRLASWLLSNWYINIWSIERNYLVVEKAVSEIATKMSKMWIKADIVMWAQMWSIRISLYLAEKLAIEQSVYVEKSWDDNKNIKLKRHNLDLKWKKVVLSEDIVNAGSTIVKMIDVVTKAWWEVVAITCVWNRYWKDFFDNIPLIYCYKPEPFEMYYDELTPLEAKKDYPELPNGSLICAKAKNNWDELVESMRK